MGGLIQGIVHGEARFARDAGLIGGAPGRAAASDDFLARNPGAALQALNDSIQQFSAIVTGPAVQAAAPALAALAHAVQTMSAAAADFAKQHPTAAAAGSTGAVAGLLGAGGWLTGKLLFGLGKLFGFGGGSGATAGGTALGATGSGLGRVLGAAAGAASLPALIDFLTDDRRSPAAKANDAAALNWIKSWFGGPAPGAPLALPGARPASSIGTVLPPYRPTPPQNVSVTGAADVQQTIHLDITLDPTLRAQLLSRYNELNFGVPLSAPTGRMDGDAAPRRGIGHM